MKPNEKNIPIAAVILAAGKGTRMRSESAKVLHRLHGRPMVIFPVEAARAVGAEKIVLVVGHQADKVRKTVEKQEGDVLFVLQRHQLGTAHAVLQARRALNKFSGTVLILCGDVPLLTKDTLEALLDHHRRSGASVTVLTSRPPDPSGYGRVIRDAEGRVAGIVEEADTGDAEKKIGEINTGIYCVESDFLFDALDAVRTDNAQREYYLTDIVGEAARRGLTVCAYELADHREATGINTPEQLDEAHHILRQRLP
jgi:bifunctional UDP-N-acetylglucosamine pyrophosphorylase/glucosamine-1-phosphate N-acetyltransferase